VQLDCSSVYAEGMQDDVDQAISILNRFQEIPEKSIPPAVLKSAQGIAILTVTKAGFVFSACGGTGIVVARTKSGWSGPSAIRTGGAGFGFQVGAQVSEFVIILNTNKAVKAFSKGGNLALGVDLNVAAGPVGRSMSADVLPHAAVYTYSRSQGLFAGVSLKGTVIVTRDDINAKYYGKQVQPTDILSGNVKPPKGVQKLLEVLARY
ncbi:MAG: YSC84-related protein, partial [Thermodesulfobacteriota bacterium]|nr:YSC84-related protein [Thermodesulfobacteriota bacterium]